jgi:hypothetical protein
MKIALFFYFYSLLFLRTQNPSKERILQKRALFPSGNRGNSINLKDVYRKKRFWIPISLSKKPTFDCFEVQKTIFAQEKKGTEAFATKEKEVNTNRSLHWFHLFIGVGRACLPFPIPILCDQYRPLLM